MSTVRYTPAAAPIASNIEPPAPEDAILHLISAATFGRMLDAEVFDDEDRVELWDGQIFEKMAKTQAHAIAGNKTNRVLTRLLADGWFTGNENPVTIHQRRVPLPDLVIIRGEPDDYHDRRPSPDDVGLIVEFSFTSLKSDTGVKLAGFAEANIPVYWVVDLINSVILVFESPIPAERRYESARTYAVGQAVPLRLGGALIAEIPASDLLPAQA